MAQEVIMIFAYGAQSVVIFIGVELMDHTSAESSFEFIFDGLSKEFREGCGLFGDGFFEGSLFDGKVGGFFSFRFWDGFY